MHPTPSAHYNVTLTKSIYLFYSIGRLLWRLDRGVINIQESSCPFEDGESFTKECIHGKHYQDWSKKKKEVNGNSKVTHLQKTGPRLVTFEKESA